MSSRELQFLIRQPWLILFGNFRQRPVTCALISMVALYCFWMGITLLVVDIPPGRLPAYKGVRTFLELDEWGICYVASGILSGARLLVMQNPFTDALCHVFAMLVLLMWSVGFMIGPYGVGQPAFTMIFIIAAFTPFVRGIVLSWKKRQDDEFSEQRHLGYH